MSKHRAWLCALALLVAWPAGADELGEAWADYRRGRTDRAWQRIAAHLERTGRALPAAFGDGVMAVTALGVMEARHGPDFAPPVRWRESAMAMAHRLLRTAERADDRARAWLLIAALWQRGAPASSELRSADGWPEGAEQLLALAAARRAVECLREVPGVAADFLMLAAVDAAGRARAGLQMGVAGIDDVASAAALEAIAAGTSPPSHRCAPIEQVLVAIDAALRRPRLKAPVRERLRWMRAVHLAWTSDEMPRQAEEVGAGGEASHQALLARVKMMGWGTRWNGRREGYRAAMMALTQHHWRRGKVAAALRADGELRRRLGKSGYPLRAELTVDGCSPRNEIAIAANRPATLVVRGVEGGRTELVIEREREVDGERRRTVVFRLARQTGPVARLAIPALKPGRYALTLRRGGARADPSLLATTVAILSLGAGGERSLLRVLDLERGRPLAGKLETWDGSLLPVGPSGTARVPPSINPAWVRVRGQRWWIGELGNKGRFKHHPDSNPAVRNPERLRGEPERLGLWLTERRRPLRLETLTFDSRSLRVAPGGLLRLQRALERGVISWHNAGRGADAERLDGIEENPLDPRRGTWRVEAPAIVAPDGRWRVALRLLDQRRPVAGARLSWVCTLRAQPRSRHHPHHPLDGLFRPGFGTLHREQAAPLGAEPDPSFAAFAGEGRSDAGGRWQLELPTAPAGLVGDRSARLQVVAHDAAGRELGMIVLRALATARVERLGIDLPGRAPVGAPLRAPLERVDAVGRPLRDAREASVAIYRQTSRGSRRLRSLRILLRDGVGELRWTPPAAGAYRLVVRAGRAQRALRLVVADPGRSAPLPPAASLHLPLAARVQAADRPLPVLVRTPFASGQVLVSLSCQGELLADRTVTIRDYQGWAQLPAPGRRGRMTLSALALSGRRVLRRQRHLYTRPARLLEVSLELSSRRAGEPAELRARIDGAPPATLERAVVSLSVQSQPAEVRLAPWRPEDLRTLDDPRKVLQLGRGNWGPIAHGWPGPATSAWPDRSWARAAQWLLKPRPQGRRQAAPDGGRIPWDYPRQEPWSRDPVIEPLEPNDRLPLWAPDDPAQPQTTLLWQPRLRPDAGGRLRGRFRWPRRPGTWIVRVTAVTRDGFVGHRRLVVRTR